MYTRTGDKGETSLYSGRRVGKDSLRVDAYGSVDELNSHIGLARASLPKSGEKINLTLREVQRDLFVLGGDLASEKEGSTRVPRIGKEHVEKLEKMVASTLAELQPLTRFILPNGGLAGSQLHVARAVCRRAERSVILLSRKEEVNPETIRYLNRLSTLLFDLARLANKSEGAREEEWLHQ